MRVPLTPHTGGEHLHSDRFSDTAHHPTMSVTVGSATLGPDGKSVSADAQLTIRGVIRSRKARGGPHPIRPQLELGRDAARPATMTAMLRFTAPDGDVPASRRDATGINEKPDRAKRSQIAFPPDPGARSGIVNDRSPT